MHSLRAIGLIVRTSFRVAPMLALASSLFVPLARGSLIVVGVLLKVLTDALVQGQTDKAIMVSVGLGIFAGLRWMLNSVETKARMTLNETVAHALQLYVVDVTAGSPRIDHFERPDYLDQLTLIRSAQWQIGAVTETLVSTAANVLVLASAVLLLGGVHPLLLLLPLAGVPGMVVTVCENRRLREAEDSIASSWRLCEQLFRSTMTPPVSKEVRVFGSQDALRQRQQETYGLRNRTMWGVEARFTPAHVIAWGILAAAFLASVYHVAQLAVQGDAAVGDVALIVVVGLQVTERISSLSATFAELGAMLRTTGRLVWVLDYGREQQQGTGTGAPPAALESGIELDKVSFTYPGADQPVLEDVSLRLPAGSVVAIVGDNGAGKTTLVKLLCSLYEPTGGSITVDGLDLTTIDTEQWRQQVTATFQDFVRFELPLGETVGIGHLRAADDGRAIQHALTRAVADDLPGRLPDGIETQLGSRWPGGVDLSGGEWQKLALARSLMRPDPLLFILDEPTAGLDAQSEYDLFERYADARSNSALTLLVSHRFSTVRMADIVVVLSNGRVTEVGSHDELIQKEGIYAELYNIQAEAYS